MRRMLPLAALLSLAAVPALAQSVIRPNQPVTGRLVASDPVMLDGVHYHVWRFEGQAQHRYRVTLASDDFDAFLTVGSEAQPGCDDCATDDDGGGGNDALVEYVGHHDGTYEIRAYSFDEGETGDYRLLLEDHGEEEAHEVPSGTPISLGEVSGELARGDQKLEGVSYQDTWTYQGRAGETLVITLRSEDFDAMLNVGAFDGGECTGMDGDDNGAGGTDSRLTIHLPDDGAYHLHVTSARPGGSGRYTLTVEAAEAGIAVASPIAPGEEMEGTLGEGDAREGDGSLYDLWSFRGNEGEAFTITLRSEEFDTFLHFGRMMNGTWEVLNADDDGGGDTDSQLTVTLPETGEYLLHANAFGVNGRGTYTLRIQRN
jgi:hypothetical protein